MELLLTLLVIEQFPKFPLFNLSNFSVSYLHKFVDFIFHQPKNKGCKYQYKYWFIFINLNEGDINMTTLVGTQDDFAKAVKELIELDCDAVEAYEAAIDGLENESYKNQLTEFKRDHERHIREFSELLRNHDCVPPTGPSTKKWLTKGKVNIANILGDLAILRAMRSNEYDTFTAYDRMNKHEAKWPDAYEFILRGLEDEQRHGAWLDQILNANVDNVINP